MKRRTPRLGFGEFYGEVRSRARAGEFVVREITGAPPTDVTRHTHASPHFCLVVRGDYRTSTREIRGRCGPSALLFHPASTTHDDRFAGEGGRCLMIGVPASALEAPGAVRPTRSIGIDDAEIGFPGARMLREMGDPDRFSALVVEGLVLEMIGRAVDRRDPSADGPRWLERAREYVHDHATDPARVGEVAAAADVHPVHLARVFRARFGVSPGEYLRRVRVRKAMEMMATTDAGLAAIAARAGFCDQSELTKAFRRETGSTPGTYRRVMRS